jgi:YidC/Oxa1 family membrane protein insertase
MNFNTLIIDPLTNILVVVYYLLNLIRVPYALGFSIIILTIIVRLILYPLMSSQLKASKKMQEMNPHLKKLKEKHKNDAKTLQQETMRLYKEHGINPAAGCLPVIVQIPIIWGLYAVLQKIVLLKPAVVNKIVYFDVFKLNTAWDQFFFGLPLAHSPAQLIAKLGPIVFLIPVLTGFFQFVQSKMMLPAQAAVAVGAGEEKKEKKEDFATAFQSQSMYIFPLMIGFFSWTFSIGLSLYWNTFTIFGIIQQYKISGLGGLVQWKDKLYGKKNK